MANGNVVMYARMHGSGDPMSGATHNSLGAWTSLLGETLTSAYTGSTVTLNTNEAYGLDICFDYTKDAETSCDILIEVSDDGGTTFREHYDSNFRAMGASIKYRTYLKLNRFEDQVKISAKAN